MENEKIKPSIFISYANKDKLISNRLKHKLSKKGFEIITDEHALNYRGSIYDFINNIEEIKFFILLISEDYLKSRHCMFEFNEISRNQSILDKCFLLIVRNTDLFSNNIRNNCKFYWDNEIKNIENKIRDKRENSDESNLLWYDLHLCSNNGNKINSFFDYINQMYSFEIDENLDDVLNGIANAIKTKTKIESVKALKDGKEE